MPPVTSTGMASTSTTVATIARTGQCPKISIRIATHSHVESWVKLRAQLWGDTSLDKHWDEAAAMLAKSPDECVDLLDVVDGEAIRAFAEAALRRDHVNGCETSPVVFLEGILADIGFERDLETCSPEKTVWRRGPVGVIISAAARSVSISLS